jgi:pimeloyl-ACP methyl ester carboxylesterase
MTVSSTLRPIDQVALPDGGHMAYVEAGAGSPVILLHGGVLDHRQWGPQLDALSKDHRVIAVDARGHGWSSTPHGPFRHCDDVAALLADKEIEHAAVVGISMGAGTAVDVALEHPQLVERLVVSGTGTSDPTFTDPWILEKLSSWDEAAQRGDKPGWIRIFLTMATGPDRALEELDPQVVDLLRGMAERTVEVHVPDGPPVLPVPVENPWARVHEITVPVLALPGMADSPDHIRMALELADMVADGRVVRVDGAAHYPNLEEPWIFNDAVRRFLAG